MLINVIKNIILKVIKINVYCNLCEMYINKLLKNITLYIIT